MQYALLNLTRQGVGAEQLDFASHQQALTQLLYRLITGSGLPAGEYDQLLLELGRTAFDSVVPLYSALLNNTITTFSA
jgi:hypothetical protein